VRCMLQPTRNSTLQLTACQVCPLLATISNHLCPDPSSIAQAGWLADSVFPGSLLICTACMRYIGCSKALLLRHRLAHTDGVAPV
jgi:hypothetical protein